MSPRYRDDQRKQLMADTRERLVNAAVEEFAREGYDAANINRITQAAGVATGTIYNYFASKKELMLAILSEIGAAHCVFISDQVRQEADFKMRIDRLFGSGFDYVRANPYQSKVLFAMMQGTNLTFKQHLSQVYQPLFTLITNDILIPGMEKKIFQALNPVSTTLMIMTFYLGIGSIVDEKGEPPFDLKEVAAFVLRALGAKVS